MSGSRACMAAVLGIFCASNPMARIETPAARIVRGVANAPVSRHARDASSCLLAGAPPKHRGRAGGTMAIAPGEAWMAGADSDNDRVVVVSLARDAVRLDHNVAVGHAPAQVVIGSDGRLFVTERQANTVAVYDMASGALLCRASTPADPVGIALSPDERTVYVSSGIAHALTAIDTESFAQRWSFDVPREPRGIAVSHDGRVVYLAHLAGAPMSRVDVDADGPHAHAMPHLAIHGENRPEVALLRPPHWRRWDIERPFETEFKPSADDGDATSLIAHSMGPVGAVAVAPVVPRVTAARVIVAASSPPIARSLGPVAPLAHDNIDDRTRAAITTATTHAPPIAAHANASPPIAGASDEHDGRVHPQPSQAWTVAIAPGDDSPLVAFMINRTGREVPKDDRRDVYGAGSRTVGADEKVSFAIARFDAARDAWSAVILPERLRSSTQNGSIRIPSALAIDPRTGGAVVAAMGTQRIAHLDASGRLAEAPAETLRAPCGVAVLNDGREVVFSQIAHAVEVRDHGARIAVDIGRDSLSPEIAYGRALFYNAREPRISSGGLSCGGCHPEGRDDGLVWFLSHGPRQTPTLAGRLEHPFNWNGGADTLSRNIVQTIRRLGGTGLKPDEVNAIASYLSRALPQPTREPSVVRDAQLVHGREVFEGAAGCAACHDAARNFTDGFTHVLGGLGSDETRRSFDTPSLRYLDATAPYFHDGRYPTVHAMLVDGRHHMGHADALSTSDRDDLEAYLRTL